MSYRCEVHEDVYGNAYIVFPDEMMRELEWAEGDTLAWSVEEDGRLILRKRQDDSSNEA